MTKQTVLYEQHVADGARMVDFHGWLMPLNYGSQLEEHHAVRRDAGMFDVSHMTIVDLHGPNVRAFLRYLLANDVARLTQPGKALYSAMLNASGGVIDDLIVYFLAENYFRLVVNSATRARDLAWIGEHLPPFGVELRVRDDLALIAVQGPNARQRVAELLDAEQRLALADMKPFFARQIDSLFIATTGYTGEDGYEIALPLAEAVPFWRRLEQAGVRPCGLAARDTLRLEAGMNLYGQEMDEQVSPLAANMAWTIAWEPETRDFIGRDALMRLRHQPHAQLVGLLMREKGVLRAGMTVSLCTEQGEVVHGVITSGTFSPTLGCSIALARVPQGIAGKGRVNIRGREVAVTLVKPSFVRQGRSLI